MEVTQNIKEKLFSEGGTLICLGLPGGFEFGIDMKSVTTVDKFMGVKMIPPGMHYVYYSVEDSHGDQTPRIGFFQFFKTSDLIVKKWNGKNLELIDEENEETIEKVKAKLKSISNCLGAYPFDTWTRWKNLTNMITEKIVNKIVPDCKKIHSVLELTDSSKNENKEVESSSSTSKKRKIKLFLCDEKFDDVLPNLKAAEGTELRFSKIPEKCYPDNSTPSEITKHSLDSTYVLEELLKQQENFSEILGEIQLSFVCFLIGLNFEAFEHWKKLIGILCSCDEGISKYSEMFIEFINVLYYELQEVQEDFLVDIVAGSNFVYKILRIFFRNVHSGTANMRLKTKAKRFQDFLTEKLLWDFSDILEEDADDLPVVVQI